MKEAIDYLREIFNDKLNAQPISQHEMDMLPLYIGVMYTLWEAFIDGGRICLAEPRSDELSTPSQLKKHQEIISGKVGCPAVFVLGLIKSYNRNRLIQKKVDFVIADKQLFLPSLLISLKESSGIVGSKSKKIFPAAQCLILFHLQKKSLSRLGFSEIATLIHYNYLTITRAVDNLAKLGLCEVEGLKAKKVVFTANKAELWNKSLNLLANPVKRSVYINDGLPKYLEVKTSINALAHYTRLNDDSKRYYAIWEKNFRDLHKKGLIKNFSQYDGEFVLERWSYDPIILSDNGFVDPLSLYLIYRDDTDDRVNYEINQLMKKIEWLRE